MTPTAISDEIRDVFREIEEANRARGNEDLSKGIQDAVQTLADEVSDLSAWVVIASRKILGIPKDDLAKVQEGIAIVEDARMAIDAGQMGPRTINAVQRLSTAVRSVNERLSEAINRQLQARLSRLHETLEVVARLSSDDLPAHELATTRLESLATQLPEVGRVVLAEAISKADEALERANGLWENLPPALQEFYQSIVENGRMRLSDIPDSTLRALHNSPLAPSLDIGLFSSQQEDAN